MAEYDILQKRRNLIVGIFVFIAIVALIWLVMIFGDLPITVTKFRSFVITVQFPSAPGVAANTPVRFAGYQIGRVIDVMRPEVLVDKRTGRAYHQTKVIMAIDNKYVNIPSNVDIKLMKRGLGSSFIEIVADPMLPLMAQDPNKPEASKFLIEGLVLQGSTGVGSDFFPEQTQEKLEEMIDNFNALLNSMNIIIGDRSNQENFKASIANMAEATKQATATLKEIEDFSVVGMETMKNANERMVRVSESIIETSTELNGTMSELRKTLYKLNSGQGSAAMLLNDGRLYENLIDSTEELRIALKELKLLVAQSRKSGIPIKLK